MSRQHIAASIETTRNAASGSALRRRLLHAGPVAGFVALSGVLGWGLTRDPRELPSALVGRRVPDFSLPPMQGRQLGLSSADLGAEVSLVNAFATAAALAATAHAHSLEELQAMLLDSEKYFQPVDKPAPEFTLQGANGRVLRLADFRGKVVVLHFIFAGCPDGCPLHAERIAEIQAMVNRTPMKDMVQFISVSTDPEHDTPEILRGYQR